MWLAATLVVPAFTVAAGEEAAELRAAVVKVDITPDKPVRMSGYAGRKAESTGVHDPLSLRVTAFQQGNARLVLVSADLIGFYRAGDSFREVICQRHGLQPSELFLAGTHSHAAPTPTLDEDGFANNVEYTKNLRETCVDAVGKALGALRPVQIGVGRGHSPVGVNRRERTAEGRIRLGRNPGGPTDKEVLVLKVADADGKPLASLFGYATHATSLGPGNLLISGDVLGLAAQYVEQVLGGDLIAPAFAGASGNIDPWFRVLPSFNTENGRVPEPVLLGQLLGTEVMQVFRGIKTDTSAAEIRTGIATLELPAKPSSGGENESATRPLCVTAARIGDVAFVGLGCELLTEVGMAIKEASPFPHTFIITHCNGSAGYLPPKHLYEEGGYEIESSRFAPEAAELLVQETRKMLEGLK